MQEPTFQDLVAVLKTILKTKKITYVMIAEQLGLSEAGVKKIMTGRDGTLSRLTQLCKISGITVQDLLAKFEEQKTFSLQLTEEQEEELAADPCFSLFFWLLIVERRPVNESKTRAQISSLSQRRYLAKLESWGFLFRLPEDRIKLLPQQLLRFHAEGDMLRAIRKSYSYQQDREGLSMERWLILRLTADRVVDLQKDLDRLFQTYANISLKQIRRMAPDDLQTMAMQQRQFLGRPFEGPYIDREKRPGD